MQYVIGDVVKCGEVTGIVTFVYERDITVYFPSTKSEMLLAISESISLIDFSAGRKHFGEKF